MVFKSSQLILTAAAALSFNAAQAAVLNDNQSTMRLQGAVTTFTTKVTSNKVQMELYQKDAASAPADMTGVSATDFDLVSTATNKRNGAPTNELYIAYDTTEDTSTQTSLKSNFDTSGSTDELTVTGHRVASGSTITANKKSIFNLLSGQTSGSSKKAFYGYTDVSSVVTPNISATKQASASANNAIFKSRSSINLPSVGIKSVKKVTNTTVGALGQSEIYAAMVTETMNFPLVTNNQVFVPSTANMKTAFEKNFAQIGTKSGDAPALCFLGMLETQPAMSPTLATTSIYFDFQPMTGALQAATITSNSNGYFPSELATKYILEVEYTNDVDPVSTTTYPLTLHALTANSANNYGDLVDIENATTFFYMPSSDKCTLKNAGFDVAPTSTTVYFNESNPVTLNFDSELNTYNHASSAITGSNRLNIDLNIDSQTKYLALAKLTQNDIGGSGTISVDLGLKITADNTSAPTKINYFQDNAVNDITFVGKSMDLYLSDLTVASIAAITGITFTSMQTTAGQWDIPIIGLSDDMGMDYIGSTAAELPFTSSTIRILPCYTTSSVTIDSAIADWVVMKSDAAYLASNASNKVTFGKCTDSAPGTKAHPILYFQGKDVNAIVFDTGAGKSGTSACDSGVVVDTSTFIFGSDPLKNYAVELKVDGELASGVVPALGAGSIKLTSSVLTTDNIYQHQSIFPSDNSVPFKYDASASKCEAGFLWKSNQSSAPAATGLLKALIEIDWTTRGYYTATTGAGNSDYYAIGSKAQIGSFTKTDPVTTISPPLIGMGKKKTETISFWENAKDKFAKGVANDESANVFFNFKSMKIHQGMAPVSDYAGSESLSANHSLFEDANDNSWAIPFTHMNAGVDKLLIPEFEKCNFLVRPCENILLEVDTCVQKHLAYKFDNDFGAVVEANVIKLATCNAFATKTLPSLEIVVSSGKAIHIDLNKHVYDYASPNAKYDPTPDALGNIAAQPTSCQINIKQGTAGSAYVLGNELLSQYITQLNFDTTTGTDAVTFHVPKHSMLGADSKAFKDSTPAVVPVVPVVPVTPAVAGSATTEYIVLGASVAAGVAAAVVLTVL